MEIDCLCMHDKRWKYMLYMMCINWWAYAIVMHSARVLTGVALIISSPLNLLFFFNHLVCIVLFPEICCEASSSSTGLFIRSSLFRLQRPPFNLYWCPTLWVFIQWITSSSLWGSIYRRISLSVQLWKPCSCWQSV